MNDVAQKSYGESLISVAFGAAFIPFGCAPTYTAFLSNPWHA